MDTRKEERGVGKFILRFEIKTAKWSDYLNKPNDLIWTPANSSRDVEIEEEEEERKRKQDSLN